jgi:hypothetical protein
MPWLQFRLSALDGVCVGLFCGFAVYYPGWKLGMMLRNSGTDAKIRNSKYLPRPRAEPLHHVESFNRDEHSIQPTMISHEINDC